ncbi:hypothetical protein LG634_25395 [Streptomyces bambusae]|uniref:SCO4983 family protein n=1 Tax=Streptomyces bambusae TaxID=1550616 RepID=UPI001CFEBBC3|nr:hypothetical protein [Streptomyces bambusae]MCB5168152.1 hypothetical protein [Streptomyces bambusae]
MYEPTRTKPGHGVPGRAGRPADFPHRSRGEELDIQLAGHLSALLALTDELGLEEPAEAIARQVARLRGAPPARHAGHSRQSSAALHRRAHDTAARALLVAASRPDTSAAILAAERMDAHTAALDLAAAS